jgi:hypothetical protein
VNPDNAHANVPLCVRNGSYPRDRSAYRHRSASDTKVRWTVRG